VRPAPQRASFEFYLNTPIRRGPPAARYFGIKISARNIALVNMPAALSAVIYYSRRPVVELCYVYRAHRARRIKETSPVSRGRGRRGVVIAEACARGERAYSSRESRNSIRSWKNRATA